MIRRSLVLSSLALATLSLMACGGKSPASSPLAPDTQSLLPTQTPQIPVALSSDAGLGGIALNGDLSQSALAIYTIEIDPDSMQAAASLKATRHGAANDDLFLLSIDSFLNAGSFAITGIGVTPTTLDLGWRLSHPFPAPSNPAGAPNGSTNRADLGITGQVVVLADVADASGNTYFGEVIANTSLLVNADAYLQPAGLLTLTGSIANTFPYQSLVDETVDGTGSRKDISNGGDVTGNFGTDGWTRTELGAGNNGWTGFGELHQGQTSARVLSLDRTALAGGLSLDVAVLAKYNDPRGGENASQKKANRLPPELPNAEKFAYRMPHGALDVERIVFEGETGGFIPNAISASELSFHITDWDARATETAEEDLSQDAAFGNVAEGESGAPSVAVCIPGVLGDENEVDDWDGTTLIDDDSALGGDAGEDSGRAGDALYYSKTVTKVAGAGQTEGNFTGLLRAVDVEDALDPSLSIALNGELAPLASNLPRPVTYQAFTVASITPNLPPTATVTGPGPLVMSGTDFVQIIVHPYNDPESDQIFIRFDWNDDGDFDDLGEQDNVLDGAPPDAFFSPTAYINVTASDIVRDVPFEFTDNNHPAITGIANFTLSANRAPLVNSGTVTLATSTLPDPAIFALQNNALNVTDPEGDAVTYTVRAIPTVGTTQSNSGISQASLAGYIGPPVMGPWNVGNSTISFTIFANDPLHTTTSGAPVPTTPRIGTVTAGCIAGSLPAIGNITLATLNGATPRTTTAHNTAVTGIRIGWADVAGEGAYGIHRGIWAPGATVASVAFTQVGEVGANVTTFDDNTIDVSQGVRYLYRVNPRCVSGGANGPNSEFAMVALQNFESAGINVNALDTVGLNGWLANYIAAGGTGVTDSEPRVQYYNNSVAPPTPNVYVTPPNAPPFLNGTRDLLFYEIGFSTGSTVSWITYSPPQLNDRASLGPLTASFFEMVHDYDNGGSNTSGYTVLTNTGRPANAQTGVAVVPTNWRWHPLLAGTQPYNDNSCSSPFTTNANSPFFNVTTANGGGVVNASTIFNWGNASPGGVIAKGLSRADVSTGTLTGLPTPHDFVFIAMGTAVNSAALTARERFRVDDLAWIVY